MNCTTSRSLYLLLLLFFVSCKDESERTKPQLTSLTESVYASLTVKPANMYYAYAAVGGIVNANLVEEGQQVKEGQAILQIDNTNPEFNAENAKLALELARDNYSGNKTVLNELKNQINATGLKVKNDSLNYMRQKALHEKNIGSQNDFDSRKLAYELSSKELNTLKSRYRQTKNQLEVQLKQAENNYQTSLKTTQDYTIESKIQGTVYEIMKEPGELVSLQEPIAMLGSSDSFIVELLVDEVDIAKVNVGQKVLIRLDAYEKEVFEGKVAKIYPKMDARSQTFKVDAIFEEQPVKLYPGLTGEANIVTNQKENVLTIPYEYMINGNKVKTEDEVIEIETGIKNFERVEVISGLDTNTYIYKPE